MTGYNQTRQHDILTHKYNPTNQIVAKLIKLYSAF